jgi:succinoglycan biosynthesis protein ExoO
LYPEISVIIPAYNTEAYIAQAIESALRQTLNNIEVIVVDDASTDKTLAVVKSFTDKRLKVIANQENMGVSVARNLAIRQAKGKWIAVLDSDDWYAPERLETLLMIANTENADMVADDVYYIKDGDKLPWSTLLSDSREKIDQIMKVDILYFVATDVPGQGGLTLGLTKPLLKREFLVKHGIEYEENIRLGQDFWFYLKCLGYGAKFILTPKAYYFYRSRLGSLVTKNQVQRLDQYCRASRYFLQQEFVKNNPQLFDALSKRLAILEKTRPYFRVVDAIRGGKFPKILSAMVNNPYFFVHFIKQLPKIMSRRFDYFIVKFNYKIESVRNKFSTFLSR